jgi:predicted regulator of Ras-like GTPase activity (Roadblock/LC7/MglB family)
MEASVSHAAGSALDELLEVSPQVGAAIVLEREGSRLVASAPATMDRVADRLARQCAKLVEAAERSRRELGREPVSQVEVATPDGHVFVVSDARWIVAAVTDTDPTVGLVFYDLKTALRAVREAAGTDGAASRNGHAPLVTAPSDDDSAGDEGAQVATTSSGDDATASGDEGANATGSEGSRRWRRRNR